MLSQIEYIWLDGAVPTQRLRSKTRVANLSGDKPLLSEFPIWSYDGSSCYQASGKVSDLELRVVSYVKDPLREAPAFLAMCEVFNADGTPHESNSRAQLREILSTRADNLDAWFGFEQEYTLFSKGRPLGWPEGGYPPPQGPFYCGVGSQQVFGRSLVEEHARLCLEAGIMLYGTNAEVMPAQWEFQIGYRGVDSESADPLTVCDHLWLSRWLLYRAGEDFEIEPSFDCKPIKGDWNGAGMHTNFSTRDMRSERIGKTTIEQVIKALQSTHELHIPHYGDGLKDRLTGQHETCHIGEFRSGVLDRGASIRIPLQVSQNGFGYLEDRRPGANANPYTVAYLILRSIVDAAKLAIV